MRLFPLLCSAAVLLIAPSAALSADPPAMAGFPLTFQDGAAAVRSAPVSLGDLNLDQYPDIVVGTSDGRIEAYDHAGNRLWHYPATGSLNMAIEGRAAIGDVDGDGWPEVVVGAGSTFTPQGDGRLLVLSHTGQLQCQFSPLDITGDGHPEGIFSSPALADLDRNDGGRLEIVFGAWDHYVYALQDDCSIYWEKHVRDTVWSSPAIADLDGDGSPEIVLGVDSHAEGSPFNTADGGVLHAWRHDGSAELPGFPIQVDEVIWSSPSIGDIDGDGELDIVVGTGRCWDVPACAPTSSHPGVGEYVNAWNRFGQPLPGWPYHTPGEYAQASPALADLDEDGRLDVVINTVDKQTGEGWVYALQGEGVLLPGWPVQPSTPASCDTQVHFGATASPIVVDVTGDGHLEIVLPSNWELVVFDRFGAQLSRVDGCAVLPGDLSLATNYTVSATAAAGDLDGDGLLELVVGGGSNATSPPGVLYAWELSGAASLQTAPWPQFGYSPATQGVSPGILFADSFETGCTSRWTSGSS